MIAAPPVHRDDDPIREMDPESLLVLCCATTCLTLEGLHEAEELLARPLNWTRVVRLARRHRVLPLLYLNLQEIAPLAVPAAVMAELRARYTKNAARSLQLSVELLKLLDVFEKNGIAVTPFKGVVLASSVYGDPSMRDAGDVDLLVQRNDIVRAADLLASLGHRPFYPTATPEESEFLSSLTGGRRAAYLRYHGEHHLVREDGRLNVDLHWQVSHRAISRGLDAAQLFSDLVPIEMTGRTIRSFSPEHLLIVLCDNGAKDGWTRLDRVCDVAELIRKHPQLDWAKVLATADQTGAERMLLLGLSLAADLLDAPLPPEVQDRIRRRRAIAPLAEQISAELLHPDGPDASKLSLSFLHLQLADSWTGRVRYCRMQLRSNVGEWMLVPLPSGLWFLYSVIRPVRLLGRFVLRKLFRVAPHSNDYPRLERNMPDVSIYDANTSTTRQ